MSEWSLLTPEQLRVVRDMDALRRLYMIQCEEIRTLQTEIKYVSDLTSKMPGRNMMNTVKAAARNAAGRVAKYEREEAERQAAYEESRKT